MVAGGRLAFLCLDATMCGSGMVVSRCVQIGHRFDVCRRPGRCMDPHILWLLATSYVTAVKEACL